MIKIYYCSSLDTDIPEEISEYRKARILSAGLPAERLRMINSARVLAAGFAELGICEKDVIYSFSDNGKPFASNYPSLHFSLAHSDNISICAFYDGVIGIDCENNNRVISKGILGRYFTKGECEEFKRDPLLLWVTKEAMVKQSGKGLALGRNELTLPYYDDELMLDGRYFKRLCIDSHTVVVCTDRKDGITVKKIN